MMNQNQNQKKKNRLEACELIGDEFRKLVLELESCDEAVEIFPNMYICPCCMSTVDKDGVLVHKSKEILVN